MKKFFFYLFLIAIISSCARPSGTAAPPAPTTPTVRPTASVTPMVTPTLTPTTAPTPFALPDGTLPDGLGVSIHYEFFTDTYFPPAEITLLKEANLGFVRDDLWPGGACDKRPWCYEYFDKLVWMMSLIDMRVVFNLQDYQNRQIGTDAGRKAFAEFAGDAAAHFKGKGVIWEVWNEPELDEYWKPYANPHEYSLLVDEVVQAIRAADPEAVIIGPSLATLSTVFGNQSWRYLATLGEEGTLAKFDAVDVHLYNGGSPESQIENLRKLRRVIDSYVPDRKLPIVSTEWGYTTGGSYYGHRSNAEEQPKYVVRSYLVKAAHEIDLSIWYDWKNDDWPPNDPAERNFGMITSAGEPKPAYQALKTLTTALDGYRFVRRIPTSSSHDYLLLFRQENSGVLVAWTIAEPHILDFPAVSHTLESVNMFGEAQTLSTDEQGLSLPISDAPQYISLPDGVFGSESVFWQPDGTFFRVDGTGHGEIPIEIENISDQERTFALQALLNDKPAGSLDITVAPHETSVVRLPLDIQAKADELDFMIKIMVARDEVLQSAWIWVQR